MHAFLLWLFMGPIEVQLCWGKELYFFNLCIGSGKYSTRQPTVSCVHSYMSLGCSLQVLPTKGAGPRALYQALGGELPAAAAVAAPPMP